MASSWSKSIVMVVLVVVMVVVVVLVMLVVMLKMLDYREQSLISGDSCGSGRSGSDVYNYLQEWKQSQIFKSDGEEKFDSLTVRPKLAVMSA